MSSITPIQNLEVEMRVLDIDTTALIAELTRLGATPSPERLLVTTWIQDSQGGEYRLRQDGNTLTLERKVKDRHLSGEYISISEERSIMLGKYSFSDILALASTLGYQVITSNTKTRTSYILSLEEGNVEIALDVYDTIDGTTIPPYIEIEALSLRDIGKITPHSLDIATALVHRVANILGHKKEDHSMMNVRKMTEHYKRIQEEEKEEWEKSEKAREDKETRGMNEAQKKRYKNQKHQEIIHNFINTPLKIRSTIPIKIDIDFIIKKGLESKLLAPREHAHYVHLSNTLYKDQIVMHDDIARRNPFSENITEKESKWLENIGIKYKAYIASLRYTISQYEALDTDHRKEIYDPFIDQEWKSYHTHPFQAEINSGAFRQISTQREINPFLHTHIQSQNEKDMFSLIDTLRRHTSDDAREQYAYESTLAWIETHGQRAFQRENLDGHITGSMFITNPDRSKILIMHHKKLDEWLYFGGHTDGETHIENAARREVREESGLIESPKLHGGIFDIYIDDIPAYKGTPHHKHYDIIYLGYADDSLPLTMQIEELNDIRWVDIDAIGTYSKNPKMLALVEKIKGLS